MTMNFSEQFEALGDEIDRLVLRGGGATHAELTTLLLAVQNAERTGESEYLDDCDFAVLQSHESTGSDVGVMLGTVAKSNQ